MITGYKYSVVEQFAAIVLYKKEAPECIEAWGHGKHCSAILKTFAHHWAMLKIAQ